MGSPELRARIACRISRGESLESSRGRLYDGGAILQPCEPGNTAMKKLINQPGQVVSEMVEGLVRVYPGLTRLVDENVLVRFPLPKPEERPVMLISGGGSGHEPAHAGYVGRGMLGSAVAGDVFTSPSVDAVLAAIQAVAGPKGVLLIVKNYTGDRLNFGLAAELARARGIPVEMVVVADDAALAKSVEKTGRRGIAGTVLVHKVAGASAEAGLSLSEVAEEARQAIESVRSMGVALSPCTVPAAGKPGFSLGENEVELGLGIHGEPGVRKAPLAPVNQLVDQLLASILDDLKPKKGDRLALMVNNLGATPSMELLIVANHAIEALEAQGYGIERVYVGTFLSALEMAGVSLSLMTLDDRRLARLDAPTDAPAWPNEPDRTLVRKPKPALGVRNVVENELAPAPQTPQGKRFSRAIEAVANALRDHETTLTALDQKVGDGDLGVSLVRGAEAVLKDLPSYPLDQAGIALGLIGDTLRKALGGTSGPLYAALLMRMGNALRESQSADRLAWAQAFVSGVDAMGTLGGAKEGDRTMLDALLPASRTLSERFQKGEPLPEALRAAVSAAEQGAQATASMKPRLGRSSYLGERALGHVDPGAEAVALWLKSLVPIFERD
ncbi:MAG TPA: dihydroxyacetone kinase subunit DhaK [Isosphaeraceae bacterium]|nr:dihydroxyacetone kinase subunit DhaK [Isosphaeraceae bacterium]